MRKNDLTKNINYFEKIDSEKKAYFLGFILADGNISKTSNRISIGVQSSDNYILHNLKKDIMSENMVRNYSITDKRTKNISNISMFQISNKKLKDDLSRHGITSDKSNYFDYSSIIDNIYFKHFLRGLFDGDGHISKSKHMIMFISTKEFLEYICRFFELKSHTLQSVTDKKNIYRLYIQNKKDVLKVLSFMYDDASIFLSRKKELYDNLTKLKIFNVSMRQPCILYNDEINLQFESIKEAASFLKGKPPDLINAIKKYGKYKGFKLKRLEKVKVLKQLA